MKDTYLKLRDNPNLADGARISPVRRGELASEYDDKIQDYTKEKSSLSNRLLAPYITSDTHSKSVFDGLLNLVSDLNPQRLLDLGCGAGEFLHKYKMSANNSDCYGCTIHLGEVIYARENFNLMDVLPIDMRNIEEYFDPKFFNVIIAHCCLQFIPDNDREKLQESVWSLLKDNGYFLVIDYKFNKETGLQVNKNLFQQCHFPKSYPTMGNLTILQKCATKTVDS